MACSDIATFLINGENFYLFNSLFCYDKVTSSWKSTKLMKFGEIEVKLILELREESSYYHNYNSSSDYKL